MENLYIVLRNDTAFALLNRVKCEVTNRDVAWNDPVAQVIIGLDVDAAPVPFGDPNDVERRVVQVFTRRPHRTRELFEALKGRGLLSFVGTNYQDIVGARKLQPNGLAPY